MNQFINNTSLTLKISMILVAVMVGSISLFIGIKHANAASLKSVSVIEGDVLKLGDIFEGVTRNKDYVIGAAPQPGKDMTLNARTLYRIASALDVDWRPLSTADKVVVRREAVIVPFETIETKLKKALENNGLQGEYKIELNSGRPNIVLPNSLPQSAEIIKMNFDAQKDYFQATIVAPSADNPIKKVSISGIIERLVSVPVLNGNLQNGDIIGQNDIRMIEVPQDTLQHNVLLNPDDLVGLTPRRIAYAGKMILDGSLQRPQLVERGERVSITFNQGPLVLTAKGKALESGAIGDLVRVTNINSSRTVDAFITGDNQVIVR